MLSPRNKGAGKRFREPFGKAGLTVAILALVFAMVGGAWAAVGLNSKQKKEVKSIAKSFQGTGAAGAAGAAGPAGPKGDNGAKGDTGAQGKEGPQGKEGKQGKEGSPWTAGGVIPSGTLVTGKWIASIRGEYANAPLTAISFPLPAKEGIKNAAYAFTLSQVAGEKFGRIEEEPGFSEPCKVEAGNPECEPTGCSGTAASPVVASGHLCFYARYESTNAPPELLLASSIGEFGEVGAPNDYAPSGTSLIPRAPGLTPSSYYNAYGSWALKAP